MLKFDMRVMPESFLGGRGRSPQFVVFNKKVIEIPIV